MVPTQLISDRVQQQEKDYDERRARRRLLAHKVEELRERERQASEAFPVGPLTPLPPLLMMLLLFLHMAGDR